MAEPFSSNADHADAPISEHEARMLRAQIRKWQERVPKLATAMRTRSEALARARAEIRLLKKAGDRGDQAYALEQRCITLESDLAGVRQVAEKELTSLGKRNAQLFQTLQITNHQLERVGRQMRELHDALDAKDRRVAELEDALRGLEREHRANQRLAHQELTRIRGIGEKLAASLREAGCASLADLAELDLVALEAADHPLHTLLARIRRDGWIDQAHALLASR